MNSLEWINGQIEECNKVIEHLKNRIIEDKKYPSLVKCHKEEIENITKLKQRFQQIKSELEAWFVVQPNLRFEEHSRAWIYLNKIYKDEPSYSVIEKNLLKNTRRITVVTKEENKVNVGIALEVYKNE